MCVSLYDHSASFLKTTNRLFPWWGGAGGRRRHITHSAYVEDACCVMSRIYVRVVPLLRTRLDRDAHEAGRGRHPQHVHSAVAYKVGCNILRPPLCGHIFHEAVAYDAVHLPEMLEGVSL